MSYLKNDTIKIHYQLIESKELEAEISRGDDASQTDSRPLVIFIHGLVMDNLSSWFFTLANPVAQLARVAVYDLRGHGFSDRPKTGYLIEDHLSDLKLLVDTLSPHTPVTIVANSFGGLLALNFASQYSDRVQGLVLVDAQVNDDAWKAQMVASFELQGEERDRLVEDNFQNWLGRSSARRSSRLAKTAEALLYNTSLVADLKKASALTDDELTRIEARCFAMYGAQSDILATAYRLEEVMASCSLRVVENCTHSVLWEETELVKAWILDAVQTILNGVSLSQERNEPMSHSLEWGAPG